MNMITNFNLAASASQWGNVGHHKNAETTGAIANKANNDPLLKSKNAETTGAVAMFNGLGGTQSDGHFLAVA